MSLYCLLTRNLPVKYKISDFCRDIGEIRALPGHYAACSGNSVPTFRDNLSVPSSGGKNRNRKPPVPIRGLQWEDWGDGDKLAVAWCQPIGYC